MQPLYIGPRADSREWDVSIHWEWDKAAAGTPTRYVVVHTGSARSLPFNRVDLDVSVPPTPPTPCRCRVRRSDLVALVEALLERDLTVRIRREVWERYEDLHGVDLQARFDPTAPHRR